MIKMITGMIHAVPAISPIAVAPKESTVCLFSVAMVVTGVVDVVVVDVVVVAVVVAVVDVVVVDVVVAMKHHQI